MMIIIINESNTKCVNRTEKCGFCLEYYKIERIDAEN